jgi:hypothetical protein
MESDRVTYAGRKEAALVGVVIVGGLINLAIGI